ncbi:hypothetical protein SUDANB145_00099 [Streptomyces sp. enrichment culture]|uniref:hypothetical protein n=2 Tax=unclassified Streptomyces TaxID=2593676 RepID=UPI001BEB5835|nr:hypothetical protein [Streptomyces sp. ISL-12]MBT2410700.1 hypothetical protein [Streptomyces sp. ISL-12]
MPHTDPYRLSDAGDGDRTDGVSRSDIVRTLLWAVVVLSAVANMAVSYGDTPVVANLACGFVTVLAAGTLAVRALRGRR